MKVQFNELKESDLPFVKSIYDYYILNTTATFHTEKISLDELKEFLPLDQNKYKSFLITYDDKACGFCYISQYKKRQAYNRTAEITIYILPEFHGKGIGKLAIGKLEAIAAEQNISVLIGIITGENNPSIALFEKCNFQKCAHFKQVGEKFNRILDVVAYQKILI